jgi:hypothetical protein
MIGAQVVTVARDAPLDRLGVELSLPAALDAGGRLLELEALRGGESLQRGRRDSGGRVHGGDLLVAVVTLGRRYGLESLEGQAPSADMPR